MDQTRITALRREIAAIEGRPAGFDQGWENDSLIDPAPSGNEQVASGSRLSWGRAEKGDRLPFGIADLDHRLGGGLSLAALHEIRAEETRDSGALAGFATGLVARLAKIQTKPILWVEEEMALAEAGHPFGAGLAQFGLDPSRLIVVSARRADDVLWTLEEGLRCTGLAAVLAVIRASPKALDLTTSRRLALRAARHKVMGLLVRQAGAAESGAATTRWRISPQPAAVMDNFADGIGRPAWRAELEKSRLGPVGVFDLEWDHAGIAFAPSAAADPVARPAVPFDRPDRTAGDGAAVAYKKAS